MFKNILIILITINLFIIGAAINIQNSVEGETVQINLLLSNDALEYGNLETSEIEHVFSKIAAQPEIENYSLHVEFADEAEIIRRVHNEKNTIGYLSTISYLAASKDLNVKVRPIALSQNLAYTKGSGLLRPNTIAQYREIYLATTSESARKYGTYSDKQLLDTIVTEKSKIGVLKGRYQSERIWMNYVASKINTDLSPIEIKQYNSVSELNSNLKSGKIDFIISTQPISSLPSGVKVLRLNTFYKLNPSEVVISNNHIRQKDINFLIDMLNVIVNDSQGLEISNKLYANVGFTEMMPYYSTKQYHQITEAIDLYVTKINK